MHPLDGFRQKPPRLQCSPTSFPSPTVLPARPDRAVAVSEGELSDGLLLLRCCCFRRRRPDGDAVKPCDGRLPDPYGKPGECACLHACARRRGCTNGLSPRTSFRTPSHGTGAAVLRYPEYSPTAPCVRGHRYVQRAFDNAFAASTRRSRPRPPTSAAAAAPGPTNSAGRCMDEGWAASDSLGGIRARRRYRLVGE
jgi:hypothetical protein